MFRKSFSVIFRLFHLRLYTVTSVSLLFYMITGSHTKRETRTLGGEIFTKELETELFT